MKLSWKFGDGPDLPPTEMFISMKEYIQKVIRRFGFDDATPKHTPLPTESISIRDLAQNDEERATAKSGLFLEKVGCIMFIQIVGRPDVSAAASMVAQLSADPGPRAISLVNHILRYLKGTQNLGLHYVKSTNKTDPLGLVFAADSDFAADRIRRRSRSGGVIRMLGGAVVWWSRLQHCVTLSTCEAELEALVSMVKEVLWLRPFLSRLKIIDPSVRTAIAQDNTAALVETAENSDSTPGKPDT